MDTQINESNIFSDIRTIQRDDYSFLLQQLKKLPSSIDMIGTMPPETYKYLCIVGSRSHSSYGKEVCEKLIAGLAGYPIVIVSGLAYGIDSIAHEAALATGLKTVAFLGSGLSERFLLTSTKFSLMKRIVDAGGAILSGFPREQSANYWTFPVRNNLMAGISNAVLVIEAKEGSGTLLTSTAASKINRTVLAVPGSIFSHLTRGPHELIRDGATTITCSADILEALGFTIQTQKIGEPKKESSENQQKLFEPILSDDEKMLVGRLTTPINKDEFIRSIELPAGYINAVLSELELKGIIVERQGLLMVN